MDKLIIRGGIPLHGEVIIAGSKNATLPLMSAALLTEGETVIRNVPNLIDVRTYSRVLETLGVKISHEQTELKLETTDIKSDTAPYDLVRTMRASIYTLGGLLGRLGRARVSMPGGCAWGPRPVDIHLSGLKALGAEIELEGATLSPGRTV